MIYANVETYLNEEVRRPIKYLLKDSDKLDDVMEVVDYLCEKYRELNCFANFCESKNKNMNFREYMNYKFENMKLVDYDALDRVFSDEELIASIEKEQ